MVKSEPKKKPQPSGFFQKFFRKPEKSQKEQRLTVQRSIPYLEMGRDGICRVEEHLYSKTVRFYDINYQLAQNEDKNTIFESWCDFLNYFDSSIRFQLSFINHKSDMSEYNRVIQIEPQHDAFDDVRMEYAQMLKQQLAKGNNGLVRTKYITFSIERKRKEQSAPKLYDLTTLQREANRYYGFTASQTLKIVQELYEEKLVTYPRTDSQYITEDMQQTMADLLKHYGGEADGVKQVVNNKKVTDHHAILPTLESCKRGSNSLSGDKEKVFALIVWKMQQAVQPPYIYEDVLVTVCCQDRKFTAKYKNVLQAGHTAMPVPFVEQEKSKDMAFPKKLEQGEVIPVVSAEKKQGFTSPPKAFTEDTLLSAMESAGNKEFEKDTEKKGLGTPATRAAILEKLVSSGYVERKGKQILPSAEGVTAIANIPDYLKSASMTAEWENELLRMERGETKPADFMQGIGGLLERMLADLRQIPTVQESPIYNKVSIGNCPVCGKPVCEGKLNFYCSDRDCKFALWKESKYLSGMKKTLTKKMATDLLKKGRTYAKDFYSAKKDKTFAADLVMAIENGRAQYSLEFPKTPAKK